MAHLRYFRSNRPLRVELTQDSYTLGRSHACDVVLDSDAVSRQHARIERRGDVFVLEDLGSRNKTYLNGNLVTAAIELADNDIIRICNHHIIFLCDSTNDSSKFQVILKRGTADSTRVTLLHEATPEGSDLGLDGQARPREKLEALLEISRAYSSVCRADTLLSRVTDCLFRIFPQTDRCYILMRHETSGEPVPRAGKNRRGQIDSTPRLSRTVLHHVFENGQSLVAEDALQDPNLSEHGSVFDNLIRSIMCVPLFDETNRTCGAIWLHTEERVRQFREADLDLLVSVASMVSHGLQRARLHEQLLEHDRRLGEAEAGRSIQQTFLPLDWPTVPGYRFYANCRPALSVGGDYYGFIQLPRSRLAIALADVSGNGMAAALLMARLSSELRFAAINSPNASSAVQSLNRILHAEWPPDRFVTLLYAELNCADGALTIVNAGHIPPLLRDAAGGTTAIGEARCGPPLNALPDCTFDSVSLRLEPGAMMLFYTDGITDAYNLKQQRFGGARLREIVRLGSNDPGQAGNEIIHEVQQFLEGAPQRDDIALVCFGRDE